MDITLAQLEFMVLTFGPVNKNKLIAERNSDLNVNRIEGGKPI